MLARIAGTIAFAGLFAFWLFTGPQASAQQKTEAGNAQLVVYHKCNIFSVLSGGSFSGADGHVYVADKSLGRTPVCSVRSFKVAPGEHAIAIKDWAGLNFSFIERKVRFAPGETAHILIDKAQGGAFYWVPISASQARTLAAEIKSAAK